MKKNCLVMAIIIGMEILITSCQSENIQTSEVEKIAEEKTDNFFEMNFDENEVSNEQIDSTALDSDASQEQELSEQSQISDETESTAELIAGTVEEKKKPLTDDDFQFINGRLYQLEGNDQWVESGNKQNDAADEALYRAFISQQFEGKENVRVALADLTHDGHEEMIVVWYGYDDPYVATHIYIYTIVQNQVREIEKKISYNFRYELYLCIRNGKACLFEREDGIYQGEGGLTYKLYDFKPDYTENILDSYSTYVILDTTQGDKDYDLFMEKSDILTQEDVLIAHDDESELWPVNNVLSDNEAMYRGSCGPLVKENGVYHYSGVIQGYDEERANNYGHWTEGYYDLVCGDFYVDASTRVVIETESDYGFPVNEKSAEAWLDDFYARKEYWMVLAIKVKGSHIEEIYGIYAID